MVAASTLGSATRRLVRRVRLVRCAQLVWRAHRRLLGHYTKKERAAVEYQEVVGLYWGAVLEPGERVLIDVVVDYAGFYGTDSSYQHVSGVFYGNTAFVTAGLGITALGNASRRSAAAAAAQSQWRELQQVRVLGSDRRLLCVMADRRLLSFYHRAASAVYPEPDSWSLVLDFADTSPLRLTGLAAPSIAAVVVWAVYGEQGLRDHPGMTRLTR